MHESRRSEASLASLRRLLSSPRRFDSVSRFPRRLLSVARFYSLLRRLSASLMNNRANSSGNIIYARLTVSRSSLAHARVCLHNGPASFSPMRFAPNSMEHPDIVTAVVLHCAVSVSYLVHFERVVGEVKKGSCARPLELREMRIYRLGQYGPHSSENRLNDTDAFF